MASLTSPRRPDATDRHRLVLEASEAVRDDDLADVDPVSWPVAAVVGGLATAAVGWVLASGLVVCGWLMGDEAGLSAALELGTRLWLLGGGVPVDVAGLDVSLVPWGLTVVTAAMLWRFGGYAARRVTPASPTGPFAVALVVTLAYALPVLGAAIFLGEPWRAPGALGGRRASSSSSVAGPGPAPAWGVPPAPAWPRVVSGLPRAVAGALGVLLLAGAAVLALGLVTGWDRVVDLNTALRAGRPGRRSWSSSRRPSCRTPSSGRARTPSAPASAWAAARSWRRPRPRSASCPACRCSARCPPAGPAAPCSCGGWPPVPSPGRWPPGSPCVAATTRRFDTSTLLGGLAGVLSALAFTGLAWTTSGDLGTVRLTDLGPRLLPLLVMSTTTLGLAGMVTGAVVGVARHLRRPADAADAADGTDPEDVERTEVIDQTEETQEIAR